RDLSDAAQYICLECIQQLPSMKNELRVDEETISMVLEDVKAIDELGVKVPSPGFEQRKHALLTKLFLESASNGYINDAREYLLEMAKVRRGVG
ncbi:MAG: phosphoenolpyruvate carboxylase, partial [Caldivirga sp.]|uniref:phosphoenolpyruvate carboxylase n=1 Tax=Caldivirga sp. TaxID=2080243 RepID=UPI003D12EA84